MPYVEVKKDGRVVLRQAVTDPQAQQECTVRLGRAGPVRVRLGESLAVWSYHVRFAEGEPESQVGAPAAAAPPRPTSGYRGWKPQVDGYRVRERIGEGGMATVWRAVEQSTGREVALKFATNHQLATGASRARFEREVRLAERLDHAHICRVLNHGLREGVCYYAMELVRGRPLDEFVTARRLSVRQTLAVMLPICRAVEYAHGRGVIHRDLKPGNILVDDDAQPHVLDFGIAHAMDEPAPALVAPAAAGRAGTPAYMSPEQAAGRDEDLGPTSDVYSLGVILYRLLTGQSPHDLRGAGFDVMRRVATEPVLPPQQARPDLDPRLAAVLRKALAHDPADRYPSAAGLAEDLAAFLDAPARANGSAAAGPPGRRRRALWIAVAVGALLVALAAAVHAFRARGEGAPLDPGRFGHDPPTGSKETADPNTRRLTPG